MAFENDNDLINAKIDALSDIEDAETNESDDKSPVVMVHFGSAIVYNINYEDERLVNIVAPAEGGYFEAVGMAYLDMGLRFPYIDGWRIKHLIMETTPVWIAKDSIPREEDEDDEELVTVEESYKAGGDTIPMSLPDTEL